MQKLINQPDDFVAEFLEGILEAHPELSSVSADNRCLVRPDARVGGRVGIVTGGGSGHLPLFLGYVGPGLCSGVAVGNVFSSPSVDQILTVTRSVDAGEGVLYLYGNYGGDVLNFDIAAEQAAAEGIRVETMLIADDVASAPRDARETRRGVAGLVLAYKIAGAAAEQGASLDELLAILGSVQENLATIGVGLSPAILPAAGEPTFTLEPGEMEIGVGIHGERGTRRAPLQPADEISAELFARVAEDIVLASGDEVVVLVNGLGSTPLEELYIVFRKISALASEMGVSIVHSLIGEYSTSLEMAGTSLTVLRVDPRLKNLMHADAQSPFFGRGL